MNNECAICVSTLRILLILISSTFLLVTGVLIDELREEIGHIEGAHRERNLSIKTASDLSQCLDKGLSDFTSLYISPLVSSTQERYVGCSQICFS